MVQVIRDEDAALVDRCAPGAVEVGLRHGAVAGRRRPVPGDGLDEVGRLRIRADRIHPPNPVVEAIGDVEIRRRGGVERDAVGEVEIGLARIAVLAAEPEPAGAGHREDRAHRRRIAVCVEVQATDDLTDTTVVGIGDEEVARRVDRQSRRITERRLRRRFPLIGTRIACCSRAGDGRHRLVRQVDRADDIVERIGDVKHVARGIERSAHRIGQVGLAGLARGDPRTAGTTDSGQGADVVVVLVTGGVVIRVGVAGFECSHGMVEGIDDVALAGDGRHRRIQWRPGRNLREHRGRGRELGSNGWLAVARKAGRPVTGFDVNVVPGRRGERALQDPHQVVAGIGDHDITVRSNRDPRGCRELSQDRRAAVAELAGLASTGDGSQHLIRPRQLSNHVVAGVRDIQVRLLHDGQPRWQWQVRLLVERQSRWLPQERRGTGYAVGVARRPRAGHGCQ